MRFAILGSGSRGNGILVEEGGTCLLVDCGFSLKETERRLLRLGKQAEQITAVLVTHEHNDHIGCVGAFGRRFGTPIWMTPGTAAQRDVGPVPELRFINCHQHFSIGDLAIHPFPVPHDAREPTQFVFDNGHSRLGVLTDAGRSTAHIEEKLKDCDALVLECNHDSDMLEAGPYPPSLRARVRGDMGHLSNDAAAEVLRRVGGSHLQHIVAGHLSEQNNTPELARDALSGALGCEKHWIGIADQDNGLGWREIA